MRRTRAFDHNDDDDDPIHTADDITQDQFHLQPQHQSNNSNQYQQRGGGGGRHLARNPNNTEQQQRNNNGQGAPQQHFDINSNATVRSNSNYTAAAKFYDTLTQQNLTMEDRKRSIILGVRNMNGWIKSIGINMAISHAQTHLSQLAREINIDPNEISVPIGQSGSGGRLHHSMFEMQQRADGIWDMSINPRYPLPLKTHIRLADGDDYDTHNNQLKQPIDNEAYRMGLDQPQNYKNIVLKQPQNVYCLDLCGGKGGDLLKYTENHLGGYILVDIAEKSVEKAIDRFNESCDTTIRRNQFRKQFFAKFIVANLCYHSLHQFLHPRISFDMTSISFSFHYAFETESTLRGMLRNISDRLRPGSCFVCTVPDARVLMSKLLSTSQLVFGNDIYSFEFKPTLPLLSWFKVQNPSMVHDYLHTMDLGQVTSDPSLLLWIKLNLPSHHHQTYFPKLSKEELENFQKYENDYNASLEATKPENNAGMELPYGHYPHNIDTYIAERNEPTYDPIFKRPKQPEAHPFHSFSPFGIEYRFTLKEAVDDIAEYMVLYPTLCQIAAEYGLKPLYHENAQTFVANHFQETLGQTSNRNLLGRLNVFDMKKQTGQPGPFQTNQWEAVGVYCSMMFQKVGEIQFQGKTIYYDDISLTQSFSLPLSPQGSISGIRSDSFDDVFGIYTTPSQPTTSLATNTNSSHITTTPPDAQNSDDTAESTEIDTLLRQAAVLKEELDLELTICQEECSQIGLPFPPPLSQFKDINYSLRPDPLSASVTNPNDPLWGEGILTLGPVDLKNMINCFRDDLYDQTWTPTL